MMSDSLAIAEIIRLREELAKARQDLATRQLAPSTPTKADDPAQIIAIAVDAIHAAYWTACERERKALDPETLEVPNGFLDAAFKVAEMVETTAKERGVSWAEARILVG